MAPVIYLVSLRLSCTAKHTIMGLVKQIGRRPLLGNSAFADTASYASCPVRALYLDTHSPSHRDRDNLSKRELKNVIARPNSAENG